MKLRFLSGWPRDVASGSGTAVMLDGLTSGLRELGVESDVWTPAHVPGEGYRADTLRRRGWNRALDSAAVAAEVDAVIGLDWDGCDLSLPEDFPHFAMPLGLMCELVGTEDGMSASLLELQTEWERQHLERATRVIVSSEHAARIVEEAYGVAPERIVRIPHGVDDAFLDAPLREARSTEAPVVLACAKMYPRKRLPLLIEAWSQLIGCEPSARLRIAGDGPEFERVRGRVRELGLEGSVELLGMVAGREDMLALYDECSVFVHPSVQESFGLVYLEALARARPVVAADTGPAPEWLGRGERGVLFRPDDAEALAQALASVLADPARARKQGAAGRAFAEAFRWRTAAEALRELVHAGP